MSEFGAAYARAYDALYGDKSYAAECDLIESLIGPDAHDILDLGCGTGGHALILAQRGHTVAGVDRSASMLARAREKVASSGGKLRIDLELGDVRSVDLGKRFDCALLMFNVLGYQLADDDVLDTLRTAARHLRPGGLLLFDVWYGPAVLAIGPSPREKTVRNQGSEVERVSSAALDVARHLCTVQFTCRTRRGAEVLDVACEHHRVRYFFADELRGFLERAGLKWVRFGAFPEVSRPPDAQTWNILGVARVTATE